MELFVTSELMDAVIVESVVRGEGDPVDVAIKVLGGAFIDVMLKLWLINPLFPFRASNLKCARTGQFLVVSAIDPNENDWLPAAGTVVFMTVIADVRITRSRRV